MTRLLYGQERFRFLERFEGRLPVQRIPERVAVQAGAIPLGVSSVEEACEALGDPSS